jgi:hypothetical protein
MATCRAASRLVVPNGPRANAVWHADGLTVDFLDREGGLQRRWILRYTPWRTPATACIPMSASTLGGGDR